MRPSVLFQGEILVSTENLSILDEAANELMRTWGEANERGWMTLIGIDQSVFPTLSSEDEDKLILFISGMGDVAAWARGDFALYIREKIRVTAHRENWPQTRYNEVWMQEVDRLARRFAVAPKTLLNNISTCSVWPTEKRVAGQHVRYKHHEALPSTLNIDDRVKMLKDAEENGWTWARLYGIAHGRLMPDGSPIPNAPAPVRHVPQNVDSHIEQLHPEEVDEIQKYKDEDVSSVDNGLWSYEDGLPEEDIDEEEVKNIGAYVMKDQSIRIAPANEESSSIPSMTTGISITLTERQGTSILAQNSEDDDLMLHFTFGDGIAYTVQPDRYTRTLIVFRTSK